MQILVICFALKQNHKPFNYFNGFFSLHLSLNKKKKQQIKLQFPRWIGKDRVVFHLMWCCFFIIFIYLPYASNSFHSAACLWSMSSQFDVMFHMYIYSIIIHRIGETLDQIIMGFLTIFVEYYFSHLSMQHRIESVFLYLLPLSLHVAPFYSILTCLYILLWLYLLVFGNFVFSIRFIWLLLLFFVVCCCYCASCYLKMKLFGTIPKCL